MPVFLHRGLHTALHAQGPQSWMPSNSQENNKMGKTLLFFSDKLTSNSSRMSSTLPFTKDLSHSLPPSPETLASISFTSFPPCALCLPHPSSPLSCYFSTFLRLWNILKQNFFFPFGHGTDGILVPWPGIEPALTALESLNRTEA